MTGGTGVFPAAAQRVEGCGVRAEPDFDAGDAGGAAAAGTIARCAAAWGGASDPPPGRPHGGAAGAIAAIGSFCLFGREFPTR